MNSSLSETPPNQSCEKQPVSPILLGSTFPLSLVRRQCSIVPASLASLREKAHLSGWKSFWGHNNTRRVAQEVLGFDPVPASERPALSLDDENFPQLDGQRFCEVWVLSPDYPAGFRPAIGQEVGSENIIGWQCLKISFSGQ